VRYATEEYGNQGHKIFKSSKFSIFNLLLLAAENVLRQEIRADVAAVKVLVIHYLLVQGYSCLYTFYLYLFLRLSAYGLSLPGGRAPEQLPSL